MYIVLTAKNLVMYLPTASTNTYEYCGKSHPFQKPCSQESFCMNCNISGHPSATQECPKYIAKRALISHEVSPTQITSFNTSFDDLWYHPSFLQETNHNSSMTLGNFKNWKVDMCTKFKNKTLGYCVETFLPNTTKNNFRQDLIKQDLKMFGLS